MITYCAGKCDTAASAGCVRIEMRFSSSKQVFAIFSPEGARFMARELEALATEAEQWVAPDGVSPVARLGDEVTVYPPAPGVGP